jgi:hypothetical protein
MLRGRLLATSVLGLVASAAYAADPCAGPGPRSEVAEAEAGWTNLVPQNGTGQTFAAAGRWITGIEVGIVTGNGREGEADTLTLSVSSFSGDLLAEARQTVESGQAGWLCFALPRGGIEVTPGETLVLRLRDTGKVIFGWRYGKDAYPRGHALMRNRPERRYDFAFRVHDATAEPD